MPLKCGYCDTEAPEGEKPWAEEIWYCPTCVPAPVPRLQQAATDHADMVNEPPHYKQHPSGVECVQVAQHFNYLRGNAIKYIWRAGLKGNELQDLRKAAKCLEWEIARLEGQSGAPS